MTGLERHLLLVLSSPPLPSHRSELCTVEGLAEPQIQTMHRCRPLKIRSRHCILQPFQQAQDANCSLRKKIVVCVRNWNSDQHLTINVGTLILSDHPFASNNGWDRSPTSSLLPSDASFSKIRYVWGGHKTSFVQTAGGVDVQTVSQFRTPPGTSLRISRLGGSLMELAPQLIGMDHIHCVPVP